ncbi:Ku protein [Aliidiomarina sedimenti]|uniref:Non-homologous end joining protein Ku n=1 Tax=Aliidiomarina sedimenti TaxID=1933879 RepID=A0ABY0BZM0_9GAMM|nr:Ku protein [Aliidiomarina sedimenti]RUO29992.1 Ku protein [Aliidiomarina sedimenti]
MAARAMWKAVIRMGNAEIPVKLYSAIEDRDVHFRLLHKKDHAPVSQAMVNPETDKVVEKDSIRRGYFSDEGDLVMFTPDELDNAEPDESRDITMQCFLPVDAIDHRYYRRPYYLGPDESDKEYAALIKALETSGKEGFARWVMRKKEYQGALRVHNKRLMLIALRYSDEVVALESLDAPSGSELDKRELEMAHQLVEMLAEDFDPDAYHDNYREQVLQLIDTKASGGKVKAIRAPRKAPSKDLAKALEASLKKERKRA